MHKIQFNTLAINYAYKNYNNENDYSHILIYHQVK